MRQLYFLSQQGGVPPTNWSGTPFLSQTNLVEWDRIVFSLSAIPGSAEYPGHANRDAFVARVIEILAWVKAGRTLVIVVDASPGAHFKAGSLVPLDRFSTVSRAGSLVEVANIKVLPAQLAAAISDLAYRFILEMTGATPFLIVKQSIPGEMQVVGTTIRHGAGHIVIAPPISGKTLWADYVAALFAIPDAMDAKQEPFPDWAKATAIPSEVELIEEIHSAKRNIEEWSQRLKVSEKELQATAWVRSLFCGTGDDFMRAVQQALENLGFRVVAVPGKRTDLYARHADQLLVIEAKGQAGPAKAANYAQLGRWLADTRATISEDEEGRKSDPHLAQCHVALAKLGFDLSGARPSRIKGALVIGTYRETPLGERTEPDFPHDMLMEIERGHDCAFTGLQLLGLLVRVWDKKDAEALRDQIMDTDGELKTEPWPTFLRLV